MFRLLSILSLLFVSSCTPAVIQQSSAPPPPAVVAADIQLETLVIEADPLRVRFTEPLFNPGSALPRANMLDALSSWFDFLRHKGDSLWRVDVVTSSAESSDPITLSAARADILLRLIQRQGLQSSRFEFVPSSAEMSSITFRLK